MLHANETKQLTYIPVILKKYSKYGVVLCHLKISFTKLQGQTTLDELGEREIFSFNI